MNYIIIIFLVSLSGLFSGLTLGLLSLNKSELKRKISLGNLHAKKVYTVRKKGNLLLCTLLLGNVGVNSALAVFLGEIASGFMAGLIATGLIVIFGEIIPQASFSRYALQLGAKTAWLVKIFIIILWPICAPIAWILDKILGEEMASVYSRKELMKIIEEHENSKDSKLDADEERILKGALSYSDKTVEEIMTPRTVLFALEENKILDKTLLNKIKNEGFTRVPVYRKYIDNIVGILFIKDLIAIRPNTKLKNIYRKKKMVKSFRKEKLDITFNKFIKSKAHMAIVKNKYHGLEGIITLEDVVEEILKIEIIDESDKVPDMQKKAMAGT